MFECPWCRGKSTNWSSVRDLVGPGTLRVFRMCSQLTPVEEKKVNEADLEDLKVELREFRSYTNQNLEGRLRDFVAAQIDIMDTAIRDYQIIGPKAFGEGTVRLAADTAENQDLITKRLRQ